MTENDLLQSDHPDTDITLHDQSANFLLKEYDRLVEYQKITIESYDRWFNIYLASASAGVIIIVPLAQVTSSENGSIIINIILFGLLILGFVNFVGLSFANGTSIQHERAIRLIQDYFSERNPKITDFLYFRKNKIGVPGTGAKALLIRGITGGSPKSLLVLLNSIVGTVLLIRLGIGTDLLSLTTFSQIVIGLVVFVIILALHMFYAKLIYRTHGV